MREIRLDGLRVALGEPRQVGEAVGYFWFAGIDRFPSGDLMVTVTLTADTHDNLVNAIGVTRSSDGGRTWSPFYEVAGWGAGCLPRVTQADGGLAGPAFYVYPDPPGQARSFAGHFERYEDGARRFVCEPYALRVDGLPRDAGIHGDGKWGKRWPASVSLYGTCVDLDDEVLTASYLRYDGDSRYTEIVLASADRGKTWRYVSTIAAAETAPDATEGPNESSIVQLASGDLMCVMRVGRSIEFQGERRPIAPLARAYSSDRGRTWSAIDRLPVPGVAPCVRRLSNDVIAMTTGRPGIVLSLSADPRAERWQTIDLLEHHNAMLDARHFIWPGQGSFDPNDPAKTAIPDHLDPRHPDQTTAYTDFVEIAPNRLLAIYDRVPYGWHAVPVDSDERNRIYVMEIGVERI